MSADSICETSLITELAEALRLVRDSTAVLNHLDKNQIDAVCAALERHDREATTRMARILRRQMRLPAGVPEVRNDSPIQQ